MAFAPEFPIISVAKLCTGRRIAWTGVCYVLGLHVKSSMVTIKHARARQVQGQIRIKLFDLAAETSARRRDFYIEEVAMLGTEFDAGAGGSPSMIMWTSFGLR